MNSTPRLRRKWELGIAGLLILTTAVICGWLCGIFGNVPPFPKWLHDQEVQRRDSEARLRIEKENELIDKAIPRAKVSYPSYSWEPRSLENLKSATDWQSGKISLKPIVNYGPAQVSAVELPKPGQMTVFLINDTDETLVIPDRDGDIYLKLEVKLENGWQRAQYHHHNWFGCGLHTDKTCSLPPHSYVPIRGYQPTTGRVATTRFAIHNGAEDILTSEEFEGAYSPDDVAMGSYDIISLWTASSDKLRAFLLREEVPVLLPNHERISDLRRIAWEALLNARHDKRTAIAVAEEALAFDPSLASRTIDLGRSVGTRPSSWTYDTRGRVMIHGFTISKRLALDSSN